MTIPVHLSPNQRATRRFIRNRPAAMAGMLFIAFFLFLLLHPIFSDQSANTIGDLVHVPPTWKNWCGTDAHGRDLLARLVYGSKISLLVGAIGASVSLVFGVCWGALSGYIGGKWDSVMMRIVDVLYSLPSIIFVIVIITTLEGLFKSWISQRLSPAAGEVTRLLFLFAGLGAVSWLTMARIVRGQVLSLRNRGFVEASRTMGGSHFHILRKHIFPNIVGVVIVYLTLTVPSIILYESFLSYLGLGIQPPQASLGSLLAEGAGQINPIQIHWWMLVFPAGFLVFMLLLLNFIGDGLRDAFDPRAEE
ncbi:MAG: ABC transporter permease [Verrucomicrobiota bacterium]|nr:ABC transporter permease [Verrucomicrobiota bacterium]